VLLHFSYAIDPDFHAKPTPYIFENKKSKIRIQTQKVICEVTKSNLRVCMKDLKGTIINEDDEGFMNRHPMKSVFMAWEISLVRLI